MSGKERNDYLLTKVPEDKKEAFVEDLKGVVKLEEGLSVLKKVRHFPDRRGNAETDCKP